MTMLIDKIRSGGSIYVQRLVVESFGIEQIKPFGELLEKSLKSSSLPVFDASNVSAYCTEATNGGATWNDVAPNVVFPFPAFWVEYSDSYKTGVVGHLVSVREVDDHFSAQVVSLAKDEDGAQVYAIQGFQVANDGTVDYRQIGDIILSERKADDDLMRRLDDRAENVLQTLAPLFATLAFLNCKNVKVQDNVGKYASRQERRAAERRNDPPLVTYKTLQIEPMKKVLAPSVAIEKNGLAKALHICRGHFAEYGGGSGKGKLFGKYEGRFYIPAHVRGSADVGVVHKRYNVRAPMKTEAA